MVKEELIQRSPVRIFESSIQGGLKAGEIGVIASPSGIGKTSVLVQIGLDKLLQSQKVIHISFSQHNSYVLSWYENIFEEFIRKQDVQNSEDLKDDLVKNRVVMHFNQAGMNTEQILRSLKSLILEGGFKAEGIIIDGYDFYQTDHEALAKVKTFAQELQVSVWFSCNIKEAPVEDIPAVLKGYIDLLEVIIELEPKSDYIGLAVSKNREIITPKNSSLRLDPKTLLILEG